MTTIIGIDAATQTKRLGLARGILVDGNVAVDAALLGAEVDDVIETLAGWIDGPTLLAVDAPLGWPVALARGLHRHRAGEGIAADADSLFRRETDKYVHRMLGKLPLEVGADRIARTAHAALGRLSDLRARTGLALPLAWEPTGGSDVRAIEVYPAATLIGRGIAVRGYKGQDAEAVKARERLVTALATEVKLRVDRGRLVQTEDVLDATVCVVAGADFLRGRCVGPDAAQRTVAETEGWIWFAPTVA